MRTCVARRLPFDTPCASFAGCSACLGNVSCSWCRFRCVLASEMTQFPAAKCLHSVSQCQDASHAKRDVAAGQLLDGDQDWTELAAQQDQQDQCAAHALCVPCRQAGCYWCNNLCLFYNDVSNKTACCPNCATCARDMSIHVSIAFASTCATLLIGLLFFVSAYSFWTFYWTRRHYFEELK